MPAAHTHDSLILTILLMSAAGDDDARSLSLLPRRKPYADATSSFRAAAARYLDDAAMP